MIEKIHITHTSGSPRIACLQIELLAGQGIVGDRHFGKADYPGQHLTLIEAEEIETFCQQNKRPIDLSLSHRNLITRGIRLNELVGRKFRVGSALLRGVELCEPCRTLSKRLADADLPAAAVLKYWLGRSGLRADVIASGIVRLGDCLHLED